MSISKDSNLELKIFPLFTLSKWLSFPVIFYSRRITVSFFRSNETRGSQGVTSDILLKVNIMFFPEISKSLIVYELAVKFELQFIRRKILMKEDSGNVVITSL